MKNFEFEASRKFWSFYVFAEWRTQIHLRIRYEWWESSSTIISFSSFSLVFFSLSFYSPSKLYTSFSWNLLSCHHLSLFLFCTFSLYLNYYWYLSTFAQCLNLNHHVSFYLSPYMPFHLFSLFFYLFLIYCKVFLSLSVSFLSFFFLPFSLEISRPY